MVGGYRVSVLAAVCVVMLTGFAKGEEADAAGALERGHAYMDRGETAEALVEYDRAVELSRQAGDTDSLVTSLNWAGLAAFGLREFDTAVEYYLEVVVIEQETGDRIGVGNALEFIGKAYIFLEEYDTAGAYLAEAMNIAVETGDDSLRCDVLSNMGLLAGWAGDYVGAESYYREALDTALAQKDDAAVYFVRSDLGFLEMRRGDYEKAVEHFSGAVDVAHRIGNTDLVRDGLENLAYAEKRAGFYDEAIEHFTEILHAEDALEYIDADLDLEMDIAETLRDAGRYEEALSSYEAIRVKYRERGDIPGEIDALGGAAWALESLNRFEEELALLEDARGLAQSIGDLETEGTLLVRLGMILAVLGKQGEALAVLEDAREVNRKAGIRAMEAQSLVGLATVTLDDPDRSLEYAEESLEIYRELEDRVGEGIILGIIATAYYNQGKSLKAALYYKKVLRIAEEVGSDFPLAVDPLITGMLLVGAGEYKHAVGYLEQSLSAGMENNDVNTIGYSAAYLGFSYKNLKDYEQGVTYYEIAIDALESVRGTIQTEELRTSYMSGKMQVYEDIITMLIELGRYDEAFEFMERSRSRSFLDMLASRTITVADEAGSEYLRRERELRRLLKDATLMPSAGGDAQPIKETREAHDALDRSLDIQKEYLRLIETIKSTDPRLASLVTVVPPSLEAVRESLGDDVCLIEYFISDESFTATGESNLFVFVVTPRRIDVLTIDTNRDFLEDAVSRLRDAVRYLDDEAFLSLSVQLYALILEPALEGVDAETLIIIPHGPLHYLPFAALSDGESFLIDRYDVVVNPSAGVMEYIGEKRTDDPGEKIIAFGNPETPHSPLPFAEDEVTKIAAIMEPEADVSVYLGSEATEKRGKSLFREYDLVHLACHASFDETDPLDSALYLTAGGGEDGRLTVAELFALELDETMLVVLSACETGLSRVTGGDELVGLTRGFLYAGTPSMVVTLWEVADDSTASVMTRFYENLKEGQTPSSALNEAQRWAKSSTDYKSPFFWAPFVLVGSWE
ncbi:MAG: CHAT domain-containing protein [Deltaproteobacteria bacterium]|nr:CHAT domain-containing protein [Candidatus Zymogenaceae bacterium]